MAPRSSSTPGASSCGGGEAGVADAAASAMARTRSIVAPIVDLVPDRAGDFDVAMLVPGVARAARHATSRGKSAPFACKVGPRRRRACASCGRQQRQGQGHMTVTRRDFLHAGVIGASVM